MGGAGVQGRAAEGTRRRSRVLTPYDMARYRAAVLGAARALFLEQGYEAVTVAQIARLAGVREHIPAHYFGGKAVIRRRLVVDLQDSLLVRLAAPAADAETWLAQAVGVLAGDDWRALDRLQEDGDESWRARAGAVLAAQIRSMAGAAAGALVERIAAHLLELGFLIRRAGQADPAPEEAAALVQRLIGPMLADAGEGGWIEG